MLRPSRSTGKRRRKQSAFNQNGVDRAALLQIEVPDEGCPYCVNGFSDLFRPLRTIGTGQDVLNRLALGSCTQLCRNNSPQFHSHPVK
jgi:hypothetical protein